MPHIACKYHNDIPAKWSCESCKIYFCSSCIPAKNKHSNIICPVCHQGVSTVAAENSIDSFWNRIPSFFLFPLNFSTLLFLLFLSMGTIGIDYDPILAISVPIIVIIFFLRYAYLILEETAKGHMNAPSFSIDVLFNQLDLPLKQILIIVAAVAFNKTVYDFLGLGPFIFSLVISVVASPASIMVLATEHSFFKAFNPLVVGTLITRIGKSYFILCIFLLLLLISSEVSFSLLSKILPPKYIWPEYFFINMYFVLIMYNMMGYVIFQYHEKLELDIEVDLDDHKAVASGDFDENKSESVIQAEILLKEGKSEQALEKLSTAIKKSPIDFNSRAMYQKLLIVTNNHEQLAEHSSSYIERLILFGKQEKAVDIIIETRELLPSYIPDKAKIRYELALLLNNNNYPEVALACVNNLHRDHPSYEGINKAYFLAAKIMCEKLGDDKKAITVLEYVLNNYTVNELEQEMLDYIKMIKNLNNK